MNSKVTFIGQRTLVKFRSIKKKKEKKIVNKKVKMDI